MTFRAVFRGAGRGTQTVPNSLMKSITNTSGDSHRHDAQNIFRWNTVWDLPVHSMRETIIQHIQSNYVSIVTGNAGCGKSSLIPYYLANYYRSNPQPGGCAKERRTIPNRNKARIWVLQPTRLACFNLAFRVSQILGASVGTRVGFAIASDTRFTEETEIIYSTTGFAFRYFTATNQLGSTTASPTHVIFDEAHNREVESDLLMAWLKWHLHPSRGDCTRLVIMSATLEVTPFQTYFTVKTAPNLHLVNENDFSFVPSVLHVGSQPHPVEVNFLDAISFSWITESLARECEECVRLERHEPQGISTRNSLTENVVRAWLKKCVSAKKMENILIFLPGMSELLQTQETLQHVIQSAGKSAKEEFVEIVLLHSMLLTDVSYTSLFSSTASKCYVVLATNIAESSLTFPNIGLVIDFGMERVLKEVDNNGLTSVSLMREWCSRSSILQRRGRVGRTQPGFVLHMYSHVVYQTKMSEMSPPECRRLGPQWTLIQTIGLFPEKRNRKTIVHFLSTTLDPFDAEEVNLGIDELEKIGVVEYAQGDSQTIVLSSFGQLTRVLPLDVQLCRFLWFGLQTEDPTHVLICLVIATIISTQQDIFQNPWSENCNNVLLGILRAHDRLLLHNGLDIDSSDIWVSYEITKRWFGERDSALLRDFSVSKGKMRSIQHSLVHIGERLISFLNANRVEFSMLSQIVTSFVTSLRSSEGKAQILLTPTSPHVKDIVLCFLLLSLGRNANHLLLGHSTHALRSVFRQNSLVENLERSGYDISRVAVCSSHWSDGFVPDSAQLQSALGGCLPMIAHTQIEKFGISAIRKKIAVQFAAAFQETEDCQGRTSQTNLQICERPDSTSRIEALRRLPVTRQCPPGVRFLRQLCELQRLTFQNIQSELSGSTSLDIKSTMGEIQGECERENVMYDERDSLPAEKDTPQEAHTVAIRKVSSPHAVQWMSAHKFTHVTPSNRSSASFCVDVRTLCHPQLALCSTLVKLSPYRTKTNYVWVLPQKKWVPWIVSLSWMSGPVRLIVNKEGTATKGVFLESTSRKGQEEGKTVITFPLVLCTHSEIGTFFSLRKTITQNKFGGREARAFLQKKIYDQVSPESDESKQILERFSGYDWELRDVDSGDKEIAPRADDKELPEHLSAVLLITISDNILLKRVAEHYKSGFLSRIKIRLGGEEKFAEFCCEIATFLRTEKNMGTDALQHILGEVGCTFCATPKNTTKEFSTDLNCEVSRNAHDVLIFTPSVIPSNIVVRGD